MPRPRPFGCEHEVEAAARGQRHVLGVLLGRAPGTRAPTRQTRGDLEAGWALNRRPVPNERVGSRAWDAVGIYSFSPLTAPLVIDSSTEANAGARDREARTRTGGTTDLRTRTGSGREVPLGDTAFVLTEPAAAAGRANGHRPKQRRTGAPMTPDRAQLVIEAISPGYWWATFDNPPIKVAGPDLFLALRDLVTRSIWGDTVLSAGEERHRPRLGAPVDDFTVLAGAAGGLWRFGDLVGSPGGS